MPRPSHLKGADLMAGYHKGFHCPCCDGPTYSPTTLCRKCKKVMDDAEDLRLIDGARAETEEVSWDVLKAELNTQSKEPPANTP